VPEFVETLRLVPARRRHRVSKVFREPIIPSSVGAFSCAVDNQLPQLVGKLPAD